MTHKAKAPMLAAVGARFDRDVMAHAALLACRLGEAIDCAVTK